MAAASAKARDVKHRRINLHCLLGRERTPGQGKISAEQNRRAELCDGEQCDGSERGQSNELAHVHQPFLQTRGNLGTAIGRSAGPSRRSGISRDADDRFGKGLRRFLRQTVPDAALDARQQHQLNQRQALNGQMVDLLAIRRKLPTFRPIRSFVNKFMPESLGFDHPR